MAEVIETAKRRAEKAQEAWDAIYRSAREDMYFLSDEPGAQWDENDYQSRVKLRRPAFQIDQLKQFVNQVSNESRMNTPNVTVIPHAGGADVKTSEIMQGLVKDIEYYSNADSAYDLAVNNAVKCSVGFVRIDHQYVDDESFEQELCIKRVTQPLSVFLDPDSTEIDGCDARFGFVFDELDKEDFEEQYPGYEPVSFETTAPERSESPTRQDGVRICEYFEIVEEKKTVALLSDGSVADYDKELMGSSALTRQVAAKRYVMRYVMSGKDVLEQGVFPGRYIPLVPVFGEEHFFDGKKGYHSLIRKAKDPQRRYNYWASTEAELLMKAPKGTFLAQEGTTEEYADDYLNPDKAMVLRYKDTSVGEQPAQRPEYIPPPQIPSGIINAMGNALEDIRSTMGLYNAFLGQVSNETSGVAISQRKEEGHRAVFHFRDNLTKSITHVGQILVHAIADIYDTPRFVRVVTASDDSKMVGINGARVEGQDEDYYLTDGVYNVRVVTGDSYTTMRQKASEFYQTVMQTNTELMSVIGDLAFEHMDFPGAQQVAARIRKTIDPALIEADEDQDPALAAAQAQNQQLQQMLEAQKAQLEELQRKLDEKQAEIQVKMYGEQQDAQEAQASHEVELQRLRLEEQKIQNEYEIKRREIELKEREIEVQLQEAVAAMQASTGRPQSSGEHSERSDYD